MRDYLCASRESLKEYTEALDQKWRTIVDEGNKLQSEEKKLYEEMLAMTKRIVDEFTATEKTFQEKMRYVGQFPLLAVEKLGGMAADLGGLPDGAGEAAEKAAEYLREKNQQWLESNNALKGRAANYRALVQAEKGACCRCSKKRGGRSTSTGTRTTSTARATGCRNSAARSKASG